MDFHENIPKKIHSKDDLSLIYAPGITYVFKDLLVSPQKVRDLLVDKESIAMVSDGSGHQAGAEAALLVMEGKAYLYKDLADIRLFPLYIQANTLEEMLKVIKYIKSLFGGITLEDIVAPRCYEVGEALEDAGIPVFADEQDGLAVVLAAALINALHLAGKNLSEIRIVINGTGPMARDIINLLLTLAEFYNLYCPMKDLIVCDAKGILSRLREDICCEHYEPHAANFMTRQLARVTNKNNLTGSLAEALRGADVLINLGAQGQFFSVDLIGQMNRRPILFDLTPSSKGIDIMAVFRAGTFILATSHKDYPNYLNSELVTPGIFRGFLDGGAAHITESMKAAAALTLASHVPVLNVDNILPGKMDRQATLQVARAVQAAIIKS